ncbi:MAG: CRTAC1 family protein [Planctomycetota bacterium]
MATLIDHLRSTWLAVLLTPLVLSVASCTSSSSELANPSVSGLEPQDSAVLRAIVQRSGEVPPRGIVDVKSTGVALLDVDGDAQQEILLTSGSTADRFQSGLPGFEPLLLKHQGNLQYEVIPGAAGIPTLRWCSGVAAADLDGDGDDDLLLTGIGNSVLLENRQGQFHPVEDSGIETPGWNTSAAFGDLDLDGDLDLYICRYLDYDFDSPPIHGDDWSCLWENQIVLCGPRGLPPLENLVFENLDGLHFRDVTSEWGFADSDAGYSLAVTIIDLHGDPHPEIFVANDSSPNHLWTRNAPNQWRENGLLSGVGVDEDGQQQAGMGVGIGDLDGDRTLDLVVTNFERESLNLYLNNADGTFRDEASRRGLATGSRPMLSWGVGVQDLDLDGMLDIFVANGHVYPQADQVASSPGYLQTDQYWLAKKSNGKIRFEPKIGRGAPDIRHAGRCAVLSDLDKDGDIDILTSSLNGSPLLYRNTPGSKTASLQLRLQQPGLNREAIGAVVTIDQDGCNTTLPVLRQSSFQSSMEAVLIIGTSNIAEGNPVEVEVRWPDGNLEKFPVERSGSFTLIRDQGTSR